MTKRLLTIISTMVLVAVATRAQQAPSTTTTATPPSSQEQQQQAGSVASAPSYSFKLKGIDGKLYDSAAMRGEVLVVSFGATWCAPCAWELVAIEELKEEYKGKPVRFLWISIETQERTSNALLKHYAKTNRLTIPVLRDEDGRTFMQFSTSVRIPLVVFFDREGRFVAPSHRGMSQDTTKYKELVRARVNALLKDGAATGSARDAATEKLK
ncbi:MAG TPA: TlpA disulfide reductase family protein [Pyrinomonadaceae bacterium]|nr:TlpA disulfide reductase family protein [Pyrinomonadaceae bacterium]